MRSLGLIRKVVKDLQKYVPGGIRVCFVVGWFVCWFFKLDIHVFPMSSDNFKNQAFSVKCHSLEAVKDIQHLILLDYMESGPDLVIQLLLIHKDLRVLCLLIGLDT